MTVTVAGSVGERVGLFNRPKVKNCYLCSQPVLEPELTQHFVSHLIEVTDNNGHTAYTFECPRCGLMDQAWGGGRANPKSNAEAAIRVHGMERHGVPMF